MLRSPVLPVATASVLSSYVDLTRPPLHRSACLSHLRRSPRAPLAVPLLPCRSGGSGSELAVRAASVSLEASFPLETQAAASTAAASLSAAITSADDLNAVFSSAGLSISIEALNSVRGGGAGGDPPSASSAPPPAPYPLLPSLTPDSTEAITSGVGGEGIILALPLPVFIGLCSGLGCAASARLCPPL